MIPTRTSRPFGRLSPRPSTVDLAKLIDRTIAMRVEAAREQGYAAVNVGCDGRRRTTMFDGSACQTEGEVCIATRQDGISACIDAPTQGNGLALSSVTFSAPVCASATGWWLVDEAGYMYAVPQALIDAAPYWPMTDDPLAAADEVVILRTGTYEDLCCGETISLRPHGDGGFSYGLYTEGSYYSEAWYLALGGLLTQITTLPPGMTAGGAYPDCNYLSITGGGVVTAQGVPGRALGGSCWFTGRDANGVEIAVGEEFQALVGYGLRGLSPTLGVRAPIGESVAPTVYPANTLPMAVVTVQRTQEPGLPVRYPPGSTMGHDGDLILSLTATLTATTADQYRYVIGRYIIPPGDPGEGNDTARVEQHRALVVRDYLSPNEGHRTATATMPTADSPIVTGAVNVAWGYPLRVIRTSAVPVPSPDPDPTVYPLCLGVEYSAGHVNLQCADITDCSAATTISSQPLDAENAVLAMPNGEIVLRSRASAGAIDLSRGERYRVRAAPSTAPTVVVEHQTVGATDPNLWRVESRYTVAAWPTGTSQVTVIGRDLTGVGLGQAVPCRLWAYGAFIGDDDYTYLTAPVSYICYLGETAAGVTTLLDGNGEEFTITATGLLAHALTIVGPGLNCSYGWTAVVREEPSDPASTTHETALSPMTVWTQDAWGETGYQVPGVGAWYDLPLFSLKVTIPGGPPGTVARKLYRFDYDHGMTESPADLPWGSGYPIGPVYDRHAHLVQTVTAGDQTVDVDVYDEDTTLAFAGTRPPKPLVYLGPVAVQSPSPVHMTQPLDL